MCFLGRDGTSWFAQLRLLLWKNWVLKKRRWQATCCELLFPVGAVFVLMIIRALVKIDDVNDIIPVQDKVLASHDLPEWFGSLACGTIGSADERYPFQSIGLAAGAHLVGGKTAQPITELASFFQELMGGVVGKNLSYTVPCCGVQLPDGHYGPSCWTNPNTTQAWASDTIVQTFDSSEAMDDYIGGDDYGWLDTVRPIQFGVVIDRDPVNTNQWTYSLRTNSSDVPWTGTVLNTLVSNYSRSDFFTYYDNHVLTFQWILEQYMIVRTVLPQSERVSMIENLKTQILSHTREKVKPTFAFGPSAPIFSWNAPGLPLYDLGFAPFPTPAHKQDNFEQYVGKFIGLFLVVAFMWPFSRMVRNMVEEKERKLSEGMKMMGLRNSVFWMSWVVAYLISFAIVCLLVIGASKGSLFKYSDAGLLFMFFFSFCLSLISLACLVTTFFSRAKTAGTLSPFLLLVGYLPYFSVSDPDKAQGVKVMACLMSPVAISLGSTQIISYEGVFIGSHWNNASDVIDNFTLSSAIAMMLFDAFLYAVIAWYLDKVWPREYGTHLKWYFLVTPSYWKSCCSCRRTRTQRQPVEDDPLFGGEGIDSPRPGLKGISVTTASPARPAFNSHARIASYGSATPVRYGTPLLQADDEVDPDFGPDYEAVPEAMRSRIGVKIRGLRKTFKRDGNEVAAVKGLDLNLYQGQITCLLGHNGAGKTTTISMLNGMIEMSGGSASMLGRDVSKQMDEIRTFMGVCPQHDVLFDDLTVYEHLEFFGKLKGILRVDLHAAVMTAIEEVQLKMKISVRSSELSGGQRRRLSLAIALIGDSRVVFLDEPTSGVDPFSRRAIWDLLTKKKQGRTLVLTTHFMDEADQLGDRIGIMHHGEMKCCGTPLFLKAKYGVGYCMTLVKDPHAKVDEVTKLVQTQVPEATILSSVGSELSYSLPFTASEVFPQLLGQLDLQMSRLGIVNYGLSVTTLEEVFIKVAEEEEHKPGVHNSHEEAAKQMLAEARQNSSSDLSHKDAMNVDLTKHSSSWCDHFMALLAKRWHIQKRDKKALCCQFLVPLILLALGMGLLRIPPNLDFPTLEFQTGVGSAYNQPNRMAFNYGLDQALWGGVKESEGMMEMLSAGGLGTGAGDLYNFSYSLLVNRTQYEQSRYGAFFGTQLDQRPYGEEKGAWEFTVLTNASATHGMPTWANLGHQALLRNLTGNSSASITGNIHPFSWTHRQKLAIQSLNGVFASIVISLAFTFIPASFAVFIVSEREYKSKHLQLISGVSMSSYWVANFVWDFVAYCIPAALSCGIIYAYQNPELTKNMDVLVVTFLTYGLSIIPFTYVCSFLFTSHSTAQNVMIMVYILGGIILTNTAVALYFVPSTKDISRKYLRHFFRIIPSFCLGDAIFYISILELVPGTSKWDLLFSGYDILYMSCEAVVYFALAIAIDKLQSIPSFVGLFKKDPEMPPPQGEVEPEDDDCRAERERLQQTSIMGQGGRKYTTLTDALEQHGVEDALNSIDKSDPRNDLIRIEGLRKVYPKKTAVKDVYFGVPAGQCFGFLGVNGAGKTTTIKILTGDVTPSKGAAFIGGYDISMYPTEVRRLMGYCPQFDAIFDLLTSRETLQFYGRIRGIEPNQLNKMVNFLLDRLSLTEYADRPAGTYSGGNKRKLSVAIALIGNPPVVFLDEPSTGMDPVSRRFMWDFISETMANRAVILTTHSMEECEALCSRIGILVNGGLKCVGSSQHLKSRFGRGYQIDISTSGNNTTAAREFIFKHFPDAEKLEDYGGSMKYKILHHAHRRPSPDGSMSSSAGEKEWKLKDIFALIEANKKALGISQYSCGQTSLEQIFIRFAKRGDIEEFGGKVANEEEEEIARYEAEQEALALANGGELVDSSMVTPANRRRNGSFGTEDLNARVVTPSSYGYVLPSSALQKANSGINF